MKLSHYPMRKIQLFGKRRGGRSNSTEVGGDEVDSSELLPYPELGEMGRGGVNR